MQRVSGAMLHRFAPSIEIVLDECFRTPGYEREVFASMARRQDPVVWIAMDVEGMVIAFLGGFLIDAGQASREPRIPPSRMPVSIVSTDRAGDVGVMETICVRSRWQRQGIGSRLIGLAEQDIDDQGARVIAIPGWKVGNRVNIGRAAVRCGYAHALTVAKLWAPECAAG
ncbi:MAG: GNAT family N-acetyltransferase [Planctomycetota bacterium]